MTEIEKSKIRVSMQVGYKLSDLKVSALNSDTHTLCVRARARARVCVELAFPVEIRSNRRLPFFLEQTTLANVENLHGYLDGTKSTNRCLTHYLGNHDTRTRRNGRSTEGVRQKHTESR